MSRSVPARWPGGVAAVAVSLSAAHAGPGAVRLLPGATRLFPRLHGVGDPRHLALTFDDGPDPSSTPAFLEVLEGLGWKATFFMLGTMVRQAPGLAAEVASAGHEIAVHGDGHRSHLRLTPGAVREDLERGLESVANVTGTRPVWFRPPFGAIAGGTLLACSRLDLRMVLWTSWGKDWRSTATSESVTAEVDRRLAPGATVVLHDSDCTSAPGSWRSAVGSLPLLADRVAARDWKVGPLGQHGIGR